MVEEVYGVVGGGGRVVYFGRLTAYRARVSVDVPWENSDLIAVTSPAQISKRA